MTVDRLVTLTGPGGSGKTSLATECARRIGDRYPDGTWFVSLATVTEPDLVASAIAASFRLAEAPGTSPTQRLLEFLDRRSVLLVVDNFEHVLPAAPLIAELLANGPG